ncbi:MAG TPA: hypothetical protein VJV78_20885 [Polyangiales bacterium]|nr:hypothetical protein [Polyangiales bacterium]
MHGDGQLPENVDVCTYLEALPDDQNGTARKAQIRTWLDLGPDSALRFWLAVERRGGFKVGDWNFVADHSEILRVLTDRDGVFSVREYGRRMRATSGRFFLGLDEPEHSRDSPSGAIIPGWNHPNSRQTVADVAGVREVAASAALKVLASIGLRARLARTGDEVQPAELPLALLVSSVLDACCERVFGVPGPSALSLNRWARDITNYHFRVQADDGVDGSRALIASSQYRAHINQLIAALADPALPAPPADASEYARAAYAQRTRQRDTLRRAVAVIRAQLAPDGGRPIDDDEVARNLTGIITGSLTATTKAFIDGLTIYARNSSDYSGRLHWPAGAETTEPSGCPHARVFPQYDAILAQTLSAARRGSPDAIYRTYVGESPCTVGALAVQRGELVIVWLGGVLQHDRDYLFGIGGHSCPGRDMGKAIVEGILRALTQLRGAKAPRLIAAGDATRLVFEDPETLTSLPATPATQRRSS